LQKDVGILTPSRNQRKRLTIAEQNASTPSLSTLFTVQRATWQS